MESDDCRLARLITEAFVADLTKRKGLRHVWEEISDGSRVEIQHGWYLKALEIIRAEQASA